MDLLLLQVFQEGADVDEARQQALQDRGRGQELVDGGHHLGRELDDVHAALAAIDVVLEEGEGRATGADHRTAVVEALDQVALIEEDHAP